MIVQAGILIMGVLFLLGGIYTEAPLTILSGLALIAWAKAMHKVEKERKEEEWRKREREREEKELFDKHMQWYKEAQEKENRYK